MHALHPRSRTTSTLFTTTLAISFLVVALPHLLPCPVDRRQFADSVESADARGRKKRRKRDESDGMQATAPSDALDENGRKKRECPVPKPGGLVGQIMGFEQKGKDKPMEVVVRSIGSRNAGRDDGGGDGRP